MESASTVALILSVNCCIKPATLSAYSSEFEAVISTLTPNTSTECLLPFPKLPLIVTLSLEVSMAAVPLELAADADNVTTGAPAVAPALNTTSAPLDDTDTPLKLRALISSAN